jgi:transcriptional regulator with XRE-family HTH domain
MHTLDHSQVIKILEVLRKERGCDWKVLAVEIGISESMMSRIRKGTAAIGPKVLVFLNLSEKTVYVKVDDSQ